jgi:hypothetical protein
MTFIRDEGSQVKKVQLKYTPLTDEPRETGHGAENFFSSPAPAAELKNAFRPAAGHA